jgi:hypothetical protein
MSAGRIFRIRENVTLNIRAEFTNVFNRARYNDPTGTAVSNAQSTQTRNARGTDHGRIRIYQHGDRIDSGNWHRAAAARSDSGEIRILRPGPRFYFDRDRDATSSYKVALKGLTSSLIPQTLRRRLGVTLLEPPTWAVVCLPRLGPRSYPHRPFRLNSQDAPPNRRTKQRSIGSP